MANLFSSAPKYSARHWRVAGLLAGLSLLALPVLAQPTVSSVAPTRNLRNAPRTSNVAFTLSQTLNAGSGSALKVFGSRRGGLLTGSTTVSGSTVTFDPGTDFQPGETVYATLTTAAQNTSNQALAQAQVVSFIAAVGGGSGTFTAAPSLTVPTNGQGAAIGDINGDGLADVVVGAGNNTLQTFRNLGGGSFAAPVSVATGNGPSQLVLGDIDNDGDLDAVVPSFDAGGVSVHRNVGGLLGAATLLTAGSNPRMVALADVNGDGFLDILTTNVSSSNVTLNLNNAGTFAASTVAAAVGANPYALAAADLNGDGRMDFVTADYGSNNLSVRLGAGNGTFTAAANVSVTGPFGMALGDLNGDNIADLVSVNRFGTTAYVALGAGNGTFGAVSFVTVGSNPIDVNLGDVDADGDLDIITANFAGANVSVLRNSGTGTFPTAAATYTAGTNPFVVASGDLDGNGSLDIVCASISSTSVTMLRNGGALTDLTVSTTADIPAGAYNNITITDTGVGTLTGAVSVAGAFLVQTGGVLATNCQPLTGGGSFTLEAGAELRICDAAGITSTGSTGAVQLTGTRTYSSDASYTYNGTVAQVTGAGLPGQERNLTINNSAGVALSTATSVAQVLRLSSGNLTTNSQDLVLLSNAAGTAMVVNSGGVVIGTATVQRYLNPSLNPGLGYRHYSSPVQSTTVADLATSGFTPVVNPTYNTQGNTATPFPTVFGFDESRITGASATTQDFEYGYFSPSALSSALALGRGYSVNLDASQKVDLSGTLNNGTVSVGALSRGSQANSGWQLLGNPYPAPLDWSVARQSLPTGVIDAIYVYKSSDQYNGSYQFYQNGFGTLPGGLIGSMQGFFLRVSQPVASFSFLNAWRATAYQDPTFNRPTADTRPSVQLDLVSAQGTHEPTYVYFENGATAGLDDHYDAEKLPNTTGLNLASVAAGTGLAVNGLPLQNATTTVPLTVGVPVTGTYTLRAEALLNLGTADVYLHDAVTGQQVNLKQQPSYTFAAANAALSSGRFTLSFGPLRPTATKAGFTAASVSLYPNPAHKQFTLLVPAVSGESQAQLTLYNVLGQPVRTATLALPATGAQTTLDVQGLPEGVYVLRVQAGTTTITKQVVVN